MKEVAVLCTDNRGQVVKTTKMTRVPSIGDEVRFIDGKLWKVDRRLWDEEFGGVRLTLSPQEDDENPDPHVGDAWGI